MEALCGVSTWEEHTGERKWEVLGWRGLSEAIRCTGSASLALYRTPYGKLP